MIYNHDENTEVIDFLLSGNSKLENYFLAHDYCGGYLIGCKFDSGRKIWLSIDLDDFHQRVVDYLIRINAQIEP